MVQYRPILFKFLGFGFVICRFFFPQMQEAGNNLELLATLFVESVSGKDSLVFLSAITFCMG